MSASDKIYNALGKNGFEPDPDDPPATYKSLVPDKIYLYFVKERDGNAPQLGYLVSKVVNSTLRKNLKIEFSNCLVGTGKCSEVQESAEDENGNFWIWCDITVLNDSIVDWILTMLNQVESRALFTIKNAGLL
jgi:hypothetical protein